VPLSLSSHLSCSITGLCTEPRYFKLTSEISFVSNIFSSNHCVYNVQLFLNGQPLSFMLFLDVVAMFITCWIIHGSTGRKLCTCTQFEIYTKDIQILHTEHIKITDIKVKWLQWECASWYPCVLGLHTCHEMHVCKYMTAQLECDVIYITMVLVSG
jgi:hypothetical protein